MLSISRLCQQTVKLSHYNLGINKIVQSSSNNYLRRFFTTLQPGKSKTNNGKFAQYFIRGSGTATIVNPISKISTSPSKPIGYWLLTCTGMVFVGVILGGVTRLTESGLSMVTWKFLGEKRPTSELEWEEEFKKYQEFPEYKLKNHEMTLSEFKRIWYMEYFHRTWGRTLGAVFFIPAAYFWITGKFKKPLKVRVAFFSLLIAAQGLMGWYMVKSGLENKFEGPNDVPRVSQYRLASHLSLAFLLYAFMLWSTLHHLLPPQTVNISSLNAIKQSRKFRMFAHSCKGMIFFTAVSGAFVAGLDAGLVYNSFPKMADKWIPDDILAISPKLANITENPTMVQFNHRILGTVTLGLISVLWIVSRKRILPPRAYTATNCVLIMAWLQVTLGITTLLHYVPTSLAASHQGGSLVLLSTAMWLAHELRRLPK